MFGSAAEAEVKRDKAGDPSPHAGLRGGAGAVGGRLGEGCGARGSC